MWCSSCKHGSFRADNELIMPAARMRSAANDKAEAEKILNMKRAEGGEGESRYSASVGIARQRQAIVDGLRDVSSLSWRTSLVPLQRTSWAWFWSPNTLTPSKRLAPHPIPIQCSSPMVLELSRMLYRR